jgi:dTDP-glucose 4,6-dehydratase
MLKNLIRYRKIVQVSWDISAWMLAIPLATYLRYDLNPPEGTFTTIIRIGILLGIFQVLIGSLYQHFRGRFIIGSFDEILGLGLSTGLVVFIGSVLLFTLNPPPLPRSVPFIAGAFSLGFMLSGRFVLRAFRQNLNLDPDREKVLIYGAGDSGEQIVRQMIYTRSTNFVPVAFLDDDMDKKNLRIHGIRVIGNIGDLESATSKYKPSILVVAIAGIHSKELLELDRKCSGLNLKLRVIPTTSELIGGAVKLGDISEVTSEDLLGRRPINTDEKAISGFISGKRILITGAGGSIGSELARQVHRYKPAFVGILDRDESAIHSVQLSIDGQGLLSSDDLILADIRDESRIEEVFRKVKPQIVFHAAALKHLPLLERFPKEAYKTNVLGTQNVLNAAIKSKVEAFINISTDKAADPTSVLGKTKRTTEILTAKVKSEDLSRFLSVRFGNVLGSRGSVTTAFRYQIEKGGPVTVTDPNVTRYFMTIPEAVHLVLQAAVIGEHGETLILDMGQPVKIVDVARQMIARSGREIEIVFTGLREGEKLEEVLLSNSEESAVREHPLISHTKVDLTGIESDGKPSS